MKKQNRTQNAIRGIGAGIINNILTIILPFCTRTVIIYTLGMQYAGLNSLFGSIINILNISELGISSAISYSMYKPLQEGDDDKVRALLAFYKKCYRVIGFITLGIGLVIAPFLEYFVAGEHPENVSLYILYFVYLINNVLGYFLFAYKKVVLSANQRYDVEVSITTICTIMQNMLQIVLLLLVRNYYVYVLVIPIITLLGNILNSIMVKKMFPQFYCQGRVEQKEIKEIGRSVAGILCTKISSTVFLSADNIVISSFLGLTILGVYGNYYYVITCLIAIFAVIHNSIRPIIGNCILTETKEKLLRQFKVYHFMYMWIASWASVCMLCLYQTFEYLWGGADNLLPMGIVVLLTVYFYLGRVGALQEVYLEAAGIYWERRWVPLTAAILNLSLNLLMVQSIGLVGVLLSTIISYCLVSIPCNVYMIKKYCFTDIFSLKGFYVKIVIQLLICSIVATVTYWACSGIGESGYLDFLIRGAVCVFLPNVLMGLCYFKREEFWESYKYVKTIISRK